MSQSNQIFLAKMQKRKEELTQSEFVGHPYEELESVSNPYEQWLCMTPIRGHMFVVRDVL